MKYLKTFPPLVGFPFLISLWNYKAFPQFIIACIRTKCVTAADKNDFLIDELIPHSFDVSGWIVGEEMWNVNVVEATQSYVQQSF